MKRITASLILTILVTLSLVNAQTAQTGTNGKSATHSSVTLNLPNKQDSVRFVVIGDTGTGTHQQLELAQVMLRYHQVFPFEFVLMMGDNMYGGEKAVDYKQKFENIYRPLLDQKVKFYAALAIMTSRISGFTNTSTWRARSITTSKRVMSASTR
jgi:hypothetical protein